MKLSEFDYSLPKELIAQYPVRQRDKCRLMVLGRPGSSIEHRTFGDITDHMKPGDLIVMNNTKVMNARLFGRRKTGGKVELFLIDKKFPECEALVRPAGRVKDGERVVLDSGDEVEVLGMGGIGRRVRFFRQPEEILNESGHVPLPPYIDRDDEESDRDDYQTVYGTQLGATASPTAGLHFTRELLGRIGSLSVRIAYVTLHTNYGTFAPVKTEDVENHKMHREYFELPEETIEAVARTKKAGGRVFAVGTTTTRVLEYCASSALEGSGGARNGYTDMFIYPGYEFKVVDRLITNFHLPKSTLMLLVSAFAGRDFIMEAYRQAVAEKYRFFSYGDAMLIT